VNPSVLRAQSRASKTDQIREGCTLVVGSTRHKVCLVRAVLNFMSAMGRWQGTLFQFVSGKLLTMTAFVGAVRAALERGGMDSDKYSGHSFQIGADNYSGCSGHSRCCYPAFRMLEKRHLQRVHSAGLGGNSRYFLKDGQTKGGGGK